MVGSKQYNTLQFGRRRNFCGKNIFIKTSNQCFGVFFLGNDRRPKREKKRKADSLAHLFNDDREASFRYRIRKRKRGVVLTGIEGLGKGFAKVWLAKA